MASKKNFSITTPRGSVFTEVTANGSVQAKLEWNPSFARTKAENFSKAQEFVDSECLRYMNPLTPRRTGMMIKSATLGTVIGSGSIEYLAPYARRQYYEHKNLYLVAHRARYIMRFQMAILTWRKCCISGKEL